MTDTDLFLLAALLILLLTLVGGLMRALLGPTLQDCMLAVQLLGTGGVGLLLLLAAAVELPALLDAALVLALLAAVAAVAVTRGGVDYD